MAADRFCCRLLIRGKEEAILEREGFIASQKEHRILVLWTSRQGGGSRLQALLGGRAMCVFRKPISHQRVNVDRTVADPREEGCGGFHSSGENLRGKRRFLSSGSLLRSNNLEG